jgi:chromosome segregation ATPase
MFRFAVAAGILSMCLACDRSPAPIPGQPDTGIALARSSRAKDSLIHVKDSLLADKSRQLSEQSQLIGDAATSARLVSEIDKDLSKVRGLRVRGDTAKAESAELNASEQLARVQKKVNMLVSRLNASESRVRKMRTDSASAASLDSTQRAQLRDYERSINDLRATVDRQRQEIATLTQRVDSVTRVTVALSARNDTITALNHAMAAHEDTVFVAIGTEKDLAARGIIRKEGGNKLLFGIGRTIVPGRSPDRSAFQTMSKSHDLTIPLPSADKSYRVVSRQSLEYTDQHDPKQPVVRGSLKITDPNAFWAPSKYLILVQR